MHSERQQQIEEIFYAALALTGKQQADYLSTACTDDEMRREVESLLQYAAPPTEGLNGAVHSAGAAAFHFEQTPKEIGPYRILSTLGEGGMGAVYLAERTHGFRQRVALKIIRPGLSGSEEVINRFESERQILANLNHPNIARLLDGGVTANGVPYFVIEFIDGQPIDEYVAGRNSSLEERLQLFRMVCAAVSYAHKNLVIHRDIKPGNILVSGDGSPKLLDFGIAKLLEAEDGSAFAPTVTAVRLLTPDYASPEQVRGQVVTTASDVYSLGVLLYQLLANSRPYEVRDATPANLETAICVTVPDRPSLAAERNGVPFSRRISGDLDTVVMRALAKDPARRYGSVDYLDDDVRRFLTNLPVQARPDTFFYVAGKYVRRHRAFVFLLCALFLSLLAFSASLLISIRRLSTERTLLKAEQQQSEHVTAFLIDLFRISDPKEAQGRSISARQILDQGSAKVAKELSNEPATEARMFQVLGEVYGGLDAFDRSIALNEQALAIRRHTYAPSSLQVAESEFDLADALFRIDQNYDRVRSLAQDSLRIRTQALGPHSTEALQTLALLGRLERVQGDWKTAEKDLRPVYNNFQARYGEKNLHTATAAYDLGVLFSSEQHFQNSTKMFEASLRGYRELFGPSDPRVANSLEGLAGSLQSLGDLGKAEAISREVLATRERLLDPNTAGIAVALDNLASILQDEDADAEAESLYRKALLIYQNRSEISPYSVAITENNLSDLLFDLGRYAEATLYARQSVTIFVGLLGEDHPFVLNVSDRLAWSLAKQGKFKEATSLEQSVFDRAKKRFGPSNGHMTKYYGHFGEIKEEAGDAGGAGALLAQAYSLAHKTAPPTSGIRGNAALWYGEWYMKGGEWPKAEPLLREAFQVRKPLYPQNAVATAEAELGWAECLAQIGNCNDAARHLQHSEAVLREKGRDGIRIQTIRTKWPSSCLVAHAAPVAR